MIVFSRRRSRMFSISLSPYKWLRRCKIKNDNIEKKSQKNK